LAVYLPYTDSSLSGAQLDADQDGDEWADVA
jgi:hypothetical protein